MFPGIEWRLTEENNFVFAVGEQGIKWMVRIPQLEDGILMTLPDPGNMIWRILLLHN